MIKEKRRLDFDYLRGIGIILVVLGHTQVPGFIGNTIYLFHLALFYFASGFFFSQSVNFRPLLKKKFISLYLPWLKYGLLFLVLHNLFVNCHFYAGVNSFFSIRDYIVHLLKILCFIGTDDLLGPLWFLRSLFLCNIFFFCLVKIKNSTFFMYSVVLILIGFSYLFYESNNHAIRLVVREALGSIFLCIGYLYRRYESRFSFRWIYILASFLCLLALSRLGHVNMVNTDITSPVFFFASGICGIYFVLGISNHMARKNYVCTALTSVGRYAIHILALHWLSFKVVSLAIVEIYQVNKRELSSVTIDFGSWWIIYSIIGVVLPLFLMWSLVKVRKIMIDH